MFLDGKAVRSLKETVEIGRVFTLSLRFPNGVVREEEIMLVNTENHTGRRPITPQQLNYKG